MYLLLAIVVAAIGISNSPGDIGEVPFSELTLRLVLHRLFVSLCYLGAIYYLFKSIESEQIWPWRWTLRYFGNLLAKGSFCALIICGVIAFIEKKNLEGWSLVAVLVGSGIALLYVLFSEESEIFKEKKSEKVSDIEAE